MGALTNKNFSFTSRSWELENVFFFNYYSEFFQLLNISFKDSSSHLSVNKLKILKPSGFWIDDKVRFFYDSLKHKRLFFSFLKYRSGFFFKYKPIAPSYAIQFLSKLLYPTLLNNYHWPNVSFMQENPFDLFCSTFLHSFFFNINNVSYKYHPRNFTKQKINYFTYFKKNKFFLILHSNLRVLEPLLWLFLLTKNKQNSFLFYFGKHTLNNSHPWSQSSLNSFLSYHLGYSLSSLLKIFQGQHNFYRKKLEHSFKFLGIVLDSTNFFYKSLINLPWFKQAKVLHCMQQQKIKNNNFFYTKYDVYINVNSHSFINDKPECVFFINQVSQLTSTNVKADLLLPYYLSFEKSQNFILTKKSKSGSLSKFITNEQPNFIWNYVYLLSLVFFFQVNYFIIILFAKKLMLNLFFISAPASAYLNYSPLFFKRIKTNCFFSFFFFNNYYTTDRLSLNSKIMQLSKNHFYNSYNSFSL